METFQTTRHGAPQERADHRRPPVAVVGWVRARAVAPARLRRLLGPGQLLRTLHPSGLVRLHRFDLYAEQGLSRHRVAVWIYAGPRHIAYQETLLARDRWPYDARQQRWRAVSHPTLSHTVFASPQPEVLALAETPWIKVQQRSGPRRLRWLPFRGEPLTWAGLETSAVIFLCLYALGGMGGNFFPYVSCVI